MTRGTSRRTFLKTTAAAAGAVGARSLLAQSVPASSGPKVSANSKIDIAFIGVGGKGQENLNRLSAMQGVNVVALCDVDGKTRAGAAQKHPGAKQYDDYRRLLDDAKSFDAAVVTIPDNHHAYAAVNAMRLGKHVYCEKPLVHDVYEARLMRETAAAKKVATQMGNSGHASRGLRAVVEAVQAGVLGNVTEAHAWSNRPIWPQGMARPAGEDPVPPELNWDMWLGPAPYRPFKGNRVYHPFVWRGWWDFGTGALGDMGCHIIDSIYWGCELGSPTSVEAEFDSPHNDESAPNWSVVRWTFKGKNGQPLKVTWYDGGKLPPAELHDGIIKKDEKGQVNIDNGVLIVGDKGRLLKGQQGGNYRLLPEKDFQGFTPPPRTLPESPGHYEEWLAACRGGVPAMSNFDYASRLTEMVLLGNVAIRAGQRIEWDEDKMAVTNLPEANRFVKREYRKGWSL
jgi:predicted dehydrogenase